MKLKIIATYGNNELEFEVKNFEDDLDFITTKIEQEKNFMFLQTITTKNVPISKLGNIYRQLEILHKNISKYEITVSLI